MRPVDKEEHRMALGTVKWFSDGKGYGFITREDDGNEFFVHHSQIVGEGYRTLHPGERVEFEEEKGDRGAEATHVSKL
jgi:CspA family cold shock protein